MAKKVTPHGLAQVIGYYSAFNIREPRPLVMVLTAEEVKILLFPFRDDQDFLVNAVELKSFKLWKMQQNLHVVDTEVLKLLLSIVHEDSQLRNYSFEPSLFDRHGFKRVPSVVFSQRFKKWINYNSVLPV